MIVFNKNFRHLVLGFIGMVLVGVAGMLFAAYYELEEYRTQATAEEVLK